MRKLQGMSRRLQIVSVICKLSTITARSFIFITFIFYRIGKFQQQPEFWAEIDSVTTALRSESECTDSEKQFLCEMFKHISSDVQHKLLLLTAEHCEDTMEHCKLLLLLLQKFPGSINSHGVCISNQLSLNITNILSFLARTC